MDLHLTPPKNCTNMFPLKPHFMKKLPRVISIALIGMLSFTAFGTAFAWKTFSDPYAATACVGAGLDLTWDPLANDNDVVTTPRWNRLACNVGAIFALLGDYPRKMTPLVWSTSPSTIAGKSNSVVAGLGLGYVPGNGNGTPFIGFFDGTKKYAGAFDSTGTPPKGTLNFMPKDMAGDNSLRINGFEGGVHISPGADTSSLNGGEYLLGWEKVSISDTAAFDVDCQYRFSTNIGERRGYYVETVTPYLLHVAEDSSWGDGIYGSQLLEIIYDSKSVLRHMVSSGVSGPSHGAAVVSLEKLCLPKYNPNNY